MVSQFRFAWDDPNGLLLGILLLLMNLPGIVSDHRFTVVKTLFAKHEGSGYSFP